MKTIGRHHLREAGDRELVLCVVLPQHLPRGRIVDDGRFGANSGGREVPSSRVKVNACRGRVRRNDQPRNQQERPEAGCPENRRFTHVVIVPGQASNVLAES